MKKHLFTIILVLVFMIGLSLLLYPVVSDYWNSLHQSRVIVSYEEQVAAISAEEDEAYWNEAKAYNERLFQNTNRFIMTDEEKAEYNRLLNITGSGVMGYIEIPTIQVSLPLYHGTAESVLQVGVGHLEGTSLPVGGESTHVALSGHRGLPSSKLFSELDKVQMGDTFLLHINGRTLAYEVDRLLVVLPEEVDSLAIEEGKDYCTLITCTPYGINSHRILVRGVRTDYEKGLELRITADAYQLDPIFVMPFVAAPLLTLLFIWVLFSTRRTRKSKRDKKNGGS